MPADQRGARGKRRSNTELFIGFEGDISFGVLLLLLCVERHDDGGGQDAEQHKARHEGEHGSHAHEV